MHFRNKARKKEYFRKERKYLKKKEKGIKKTRLDD
jgi:hypothetical protein